MTDSTQGENPAETTSPKLATATESPFVQKLESAQAHPYKILPRYALRSIAYEWEPTWYFFYDTLTNPTTLAKILELSKTPTLRPASVRSYSLTSWGQYLALVDEGPMDNVVQGQAYLVQSEEDENRLAQYETDHYSTAPVIISFEDTSLGRVDGKTFLFAGESQPMKYVEC